MLLGFDIPLANLCMQVFYTVAFFFFFQTVALGKYKLPLRKIPQKRFTIFHIGLNLESLVSLFPLIPDVYDLVIFIPNLSPTLRPLPEFYVRYRLVRPQSNLSSAKSRPDF